MHKYFIYLLAVLFMAAACRQATDNEHVGAKASAPEVALDQTAAAQSVAAPPAPQTTEKKVIKEGELAFETRDISTTRKALIELTRQLGGYIEHENQQKDDYSRNSTYSMTIRVPAQHFDKLVNTAAGQASHIDNKSIRSTDVTTQYIDIKTRLENKKALEQRYLELLKKASKMDDILAIESKLAEVRSEIESTQGQFNYLNKQVAYSTLTVSFYTKALVEGEGFFHKLRNAFGNGFDILSGLFFGTIAAWPLILLAVLAAWLIRRFWKRRKRA